MEAEELNCTLTGEVLANLSVEAGLCKEVHRGPGRRLRSLTQVWSSKSQREGYGTTACWVKADESGE